MGYGSQCACYVYVDTHCQRYFSGRLISRKAIDKSGDFGHFAPAEKSGVPAH